MSASPFCADTLATVDRGSGSSAAASASDDLTVAGSTIVVVSMVDASAETGSTITRTADS